MLYTGRVASTISVMKLSADTSLLSTIVAELCRVVSKDAQRLLLPLVADDTGGKSGRHECDEDKLGKTQHVEHHLAHLRIESLWSPLSQI